MGIQKGQEDRLFHQFVNEFHGGIEGLGQRGDGRVSLSKNIVADFTGDIDLAGGSGHDVGRQKSLPKHPQMLAFRTFGADRVFTQLLAECLVRFPVPFRFEGEFQRFQAVVLGKVGHKSTEGVRSGGGVC